MSYTDTQRGNIRRWAGQLGVRSSNTYRGGYNAGHVVRAAQGVVNDPNASAGRKRIANAILRVARRGGSI